MRLLFILFFLIISQSIIAQFGLRVKYNQNDFGTLKEVPSFNGNDVFSSTFEVGIDYWIRLKNIRLEFNPELSYERGNDDLGGGITNSVSVSAINFNLNTSLYFLDLQNDCDCPTFSKDGNAFTKGIHLIISPGLTYNKFDIENFSSSNSASWTAGIGAGMDIGVNNLITLTPFAIFRYKSNLKWDEIENTPGNGAIDNFNVTQFQFGLRIGLRPDYNQPLFRR